MSSPDARCHHPHGLLGMSYGELVPLLVKAIQQQQAEMERLAARVAELESGEGGR